MSTPSLISSNHSAIADTVPTEIWMEIFQNVDRKPTAAYTHTERDLSRRSIMSASQTCRGWRDITLGTPSFWTTISVDFNSSTPSNNLYLTQLSLGRSHDDLLSISLFNIPAADDGAAESHKCLAVIFSEMPRWKDAILSWTSSRFDFWSSRESLMNQNDACELESLILRETPCKDIIGRPGTLPSDIWLRALFLRRLVVVLEADPYSAPPVTYTFWATWYDIPYWLLTHLYLDVHPKETFWAESLVREIFTGAKDMISCFVTGITVEGPSLLTSPPILLRHLRHLYLSTSVDSASTRGSSMSQLLANITAPCLATLSIARDLAWDIGSYQDFILRSSCLLEELNIISTPIPISDAITCMELSPSLRNVSFCNFTLDDFFLASWTAWDVEKLRYQLCPSLEQLSVSGNAHDCLSIAQETSGTSLITQALTSRIHPPTGGSDKFTFLIPTINDEDVSPDLRALCTEPSGLIIAFNDDMLKKGALWELHADR